MFKILSPISALVTCAALAGAAYIAVEDRLGINLMQAYSAPSRIYKAAAPQEPVWGAAAPGRVQPKGGEVHIAASVPAAIREVLVQLNDHVKSGDLLVRFEDDELQAKLAAAKAAAAARMSDRDSIDVRGLALDRRKADDRVYLAERGLFDARFDFDRITSQFKASSVSQADLDKARAAIVLAKEKLEQEQAQFKRLQSSEKMPPPTREEAALAAARADVAAISAALERTRIRAPFDGTVLEINAKAGETPGSSSDASLLTLGDTAHLQIRAEVEERDIAKIHPGQMASVKSGAFPGRSFNAEVAVVAEALGAPQFFSRSQRRPADIDILEVVLNLDDGTPLLPGMRVDVYFKAEDAAPKSSSAADNR